MPRSATVWAAALVLASFSGSGPVVTMAEAMPAPGPQQTQGRPRYYFPRHVKRQIVTNTTAPAVPTSSPDSSSSTSTEKLSSRQFPNFMSFVLGSSSADTSSSEQDVNTSEFDAISTPSTNIIVTATPEQPAGTGDALPPVVAPSPSPIVAESPVSQPPANSRLDPTSDTPDVVSPAPVPTPVPETPSQAPEETPSADRPLESPVLPSSSVAPEPVFEPEPVVVSSASPIASPQPLLPIASSGLGLPEIIVPPTPTPETSASEFPQISIPPSALPVAPTGALPFPVASSAPAEEPPVVSSPPVVESPSPSPSAGGLLGGILSPILVPLAPSTGAQIPSSEPTPISVPDVVPSGGLPESNSIVQPTPAPVESPQQSSAPEASNIEGPFIIPGSSEVPAPVSSSEPLLGGLVSSLLAPVVPSPTGAIGTGDVSIPIVQPTPSPVESDPQPILSLAPSNIIIGITTALGTGEVPTPTAPALSSGAIPTSENGAIPTSETGPASSGLLNLPPILSTVDGILPSSGLLNPTAPAASALPSGILPPVLSSVVSDVPPSVVPTGTVPVVIPSILPSGLQPSEAIPSGVLPSSGVVPTGAVSSGLLPSVVPSSGALPLPSETPGVVPSLTSGILPSGTALPSGSVSPAPTPVPSESLTIPVSEEPPVSSVASSIGLTPPTSANVTVSDAPTPSAAVSVSITASVSNSPSIAIPTIATPTSKAPPAQSLSATATDSATSLVIGTSIIMEPSTMATPSPTSSGIPSSLPKMIAPPGPMPSAIPKDSFLGQVCFKWPLNYPFVSANDGGKQIFHYLPQAIADGLDIPVEQVQNMGLKPLDTTAYQGFITTLALFTIPADLQDKLRVKLRTPADKFWHNNDTTVNDLTSQINTACPLPAAGGDNSAPNQSGDGPASTSDDGSNDGGAMGGDLGASRKVNSTSAIVASSAIVGAFAYGAAMFFVARRYRNKRIAHQRASSVPSTSRNTFGSIPGGAAAWMHGARNGRLTPGSRGSSSSQGRSVRTQQISAPVMAENSLGWN